MRKFLALLLIALAGCVPKPTLQMGEVNLSNENPRFSVTRVGVFSDAVAYDHVRGVYVIVDKQTGKEYVGVSGVGIAETGSHSIGKTQARDER